jgi:hypothetical protein
MVIEKIELDRLRSTYPNPPRNRIEQIKELIIKDNCVDLIPPILCSKKNKLLYILDGNKRFQAVKELKSKFNFNYMWAEY